MRPVSIHEDTDIVSRRPGTDANCVALAELVVLDDADAALLRYGDRPVGGMAVDDHDLIAVRQSSFDDQPERAFLIPGRDDDTNPSRQLGDGDVDSRSAIGGARSLRDRRLAV